MAANVFQHKFTKSEEVKIATELSPAPRKQLQSVKPEMNLPGTVFFSVWLQATSSRQMSSMRALVATEIPGDPTAVAFGDMETRSATTASKSTEVISRSQAKIRSIRSADLKPLAKRSHTAPCDESCFSSQGFLFICSLSWLSARPG